MLTCTKLEEQDTQVKAKGFYTFTSHSLLTKIHVRNPSKPSPSHPFRKLVVPHRIDTFAVFSPLFNDIPCHSCVKFSILETAMANKPGEKKHCEGTKIEMCVYGPDKKVVNMIRNEEGVHEAEVNVNLLGTWCVGRIQRKPTGGGFSVEFVAEYQCV